MLDVSSEVKQLYQTGSVPKTVIINFYPIGTYRVHPGEVILPDASLYPGSKGTPSASLDNRNIVQELMTISEGLWSGEKINFRSCVSNKCTITMFNVPEDVYDYDMEVIQIINGNRIPLFTGTVDEAKERNGKTEIVAYDYLYENYDEEMIAWYNSLEFPMTVKAFRLALYDAFDIPYEEIELINDGLMLSKAEIDSINGRELLKMMAELNGAFVHVNRYNKLTFIALQRYAPLWPSDELLPESELHPGLQTSDNNIENIYSYASCMHEQYKTKDIDKVVLISGEERFESGAGTNIYEVKNNLLFDSVEDKQLALDNLFLMIKELPYVPHTTEIRGRAYVEVGDVLSIKTNKKTFNTYVFNRTLKGVQALRDTYEAEGEEYHNSAYAV